MENPFKVVEERNPLYIPKYNHFWNLRKIIQHPKIAILYIARFLKRYIVARVKSYFYEELVEGKEYNTPKDMGSYKLHKEYCTKEVRK